MSGHREYAGVGVGIDKQLFGVGDDSSSVGSGSGSDEHIEQQERMYEGGSESNNSGNDDQSSEKKPRLARQEPNHILSRQSSTDSSGPDASNRLRYLLGSSGDAILSLPSESEFETHLHVPKRSRRSRPRYTLSVYPSNHNGYNSCGQTPIQEGISSSQGVMVTEVLLLVCLTHEFWGLWTLDLTRGRYSLAGQPYSHCASEAGPRD